MSEATHTPKFAVGQVVMFGREGKRSLPVVVLEVMEDDAAYFYRIDQKNLLHEPMLRPLTTREKGCDIEPDLLGALKGTLQSFYDAKDAYAFVDVFQNKCLMICEAAIAKAEGREK